MQSIPERTLCDTSTFAERVPDVNLPRPSMLEPLYPPILASTSLPLPTATTLLFSAFGILSVAIVSFLPVTTAAALLLPATVPLTAPTALMFPVMFAVLAAARRKY